MIKVGGQNKKGKNKKITSSQFANVSSIGFYGEKHTYYFKHHRKGSQAMIKAQSAIKNTEY